MSRGYNAFVRGSRRSFSLATNMVTTTTTMMMMMMMMMIISVMILPCSSLNRVEMTSLKPFEGFGEDGPTQMNITCHLEAEDLSFFRLRRNNEVVVDIGFHDGMGFFELVRALNGFDCNLPQSRTINGVLKCWKENLDCADAGSYTCEISDAKRSKSRMLKVKSFVKRLDHINTPLETKEEKKEEKKVSTFSCLVYASPDADKTVTFRWTVKHKIKNAKPQMTDKKILLPKTDQHCVPVQSLFKHAVTDEDKNGTSISCSAFGRTLSEDVNIYGARSGSPISALLHTAWFSVSRLSLLFLALASCR
ncbi:uncharacterized protein LOC118766831 [Octopus sinensis]|uniref:Uncharacterized protein LOC118766831 n=1 Tax=Octopus sinensis TaxID=2607531 RepID=A0A7E6FG61_9MOLL|nr:uncharacterized protein LOC118766831 [Octopus sinensis]